MSFLDALRYRWRVWTNPRAHEREVSEEVDLHVELETMQRAHAARSTAAARDARRGARRRFGNLTYYREEVRRTSGLGSLDVLQQDVRFALRTFVRAPAFTAVAVVTLALGIGANTAIFSAVDALLLRPLPFKDPDALMNLTLGLPPSGERPSRDDIPWSYAKFNVFRTSQTVFEDVTLWYYTQFTIRTADDAERGWGEFIDSRYFATLGIRPAMGRTLLAEEDVPEARRSVIVSHSLWQRAFNADPHVLGARLVIDGDPYTIVGVMPAGVRGLSGLADMWIPTASPPVAWGRELMSNPWNHAFHALGRLAPGMTPTRARAAMQHLGSVIDAAYPDPANRVRLSATARELDATRVDARVRRTLFILFGAVGLVLLIACVNVANLFLVRASGRRREIAVRLAIGAERGRIVRQLLVESLLLAMLGGVASLALAAWGVKMLASLQPASVLRLQTIGGLGAVDFASIQLNLGALAFTVVLALGTGILFGLVPALQSTRPVLTQTLKDDGGGRDQHVRRPTSRNVLVMVEIALAVVLLAGSGLMIRSLARLLDVRPGFSADHVLTMRVNRDPEWSRDSISRFYDVALARLAQIPGMVSVAMGDCAPLTWGCSAASAIVPRDRPAPTAGNEQFALIHWTTPQWHSLLQVQLVRGRFFTSDDRHDREPVVLISETAARRLWPSEDPVGRPLSLGLDGLRDTARVVGVVGDVLYETMDSLPRAEVYVPYHQRPLSYRMMFFLKVRGDPLAMAPAARRALREVAPGFPVHDVMSMQGRVDVVLGYARFSAFLLALFAGLALLLAMIGTYGVISFSVAQRRRELGVRVALGATRAHIMKLVVGQGAVLAAIGGACGLVGALAATRLLRSLLYEIEPADPATLGGILALLAIAVIAATWIPARRAARVPAMQALRGD